AAPGVERGVHRARGPHPGAAAGAQQLDPPASVAPIAAGGRACLALCLAVARKHAIEWIIFEAAIPFGGTGACSISIQTPAFRRRRRCLARRESGARRVLMGDFGSPSVALDG